MISIIENFVDFAIITESLSGEFNISYITNMSCNILYKNTNDHTLVQHHNNQRLNVSMFNDMDTKLQENIFSNIKYNEINFNKGDTIYFWCNIILCLTSGIIQNITSNENVIIIDTEQYEIRLVNLDNTLVPNY